VGAPQTEPSPGAPSVQADLGLGALDGVSDLIASMHASSDLVTMLQRVVDGVVSRLGFQVALVDRFVESGPEDVFEAVAVAGDPEGCEVLLHRRVPAKGVLEEIELADRWGTLRFMPHDRLPSDAESSWIPDIPVSSDPDAWHPMDALYAPLIGPGGDLLGVLSVDLPEHGRRPSKDERRILEVYAVQAGLALHHAHERALLEERLRIDPAVREVVEAAATGLDFVDVLSACHDPLLEGFGCDLVRIKLFMDLEAPDAPPVDRTRVRVDFDGLLYPATEISALAPMAERLGEAEAMRLGMVISEATKKMVREAWPHRTITITADSDDAGDLLSPEESEAVRLVVREFGAASVAFVPIGAGDEVLGYLTLFRLGTHARWTEVEREAALEIGREIGLAVRRARLYQRERLLVAQLTDLDHYKGEMIRSVTHELKNMMTAIRGHTELLGEVLEEGSLGANSARVIARNVDRLDRLCADMLMLARVNEGRRPFIPVPVDLRAVVVDAMEGHSVETLRPKLTVTPPEGDGILLVRGMPEELLMAVGNVYANAIKYTPDGGSIRVELERTGKDVVLTVADTGIGIAAGDLATLFDEFDRSSNPDAKRRPGSGLGLAIVKRVMSRHHGRVEVTSELGEGSTFRLVVPAWES
jgi:signal transduction histidine kinase